MKKISIGIVTRNRERSLEETLISITEQNLKPFEIIIVENNTKKTLQKLINKYSNKLYIRYFLVREKGIALCRNVVLDKATGDIVSYVDDDCILRKDWCNKIMSNFENSKVVAVAGSFGNYYSANVVSELENDIYYTWMSQYMDPKKKAVLSSGMFVNTRNLSLRLKFVRKSNVRFNQKAPFKTEDTDFGIRLYDYLIRRKMKMVYDPGIFVLHKNSTNFVDFLKRQKFSKKGEEWLANKYPGYEKIEKMNKNAYEKLMDENGWARLFFVSTGFLGRQKKRIDYFLRQRRLLWKIKS